MKKSTLFVLGLYVLAVLTIGIVACHKALSTDDKKKASAILSPVKSTVAALVARETTTSSTLFTNDIGKVIPADSVRAWTGNFNKAFSVITPYAIKSSALKEISKQDSCVGIIFYHAINDQGWLVLPYGITAAGHIIKTDRVPTVSGSVSWEQAKQWVGNYKKAHPGEIEAHFFGNILLTTLIDQKGFKTMGFQMGWNSKGEQLVLTNPINASSYDGGDAGRPCPPLCPTIDIQGL